MIIYNDDENRKFNGVNEIMPKLSTARNVVYRVTACVATIAVHQGPVIIRQRSPL